ncbi:11313_t:CDS:10 [Funneliformis caledonium]|uniref:11313_t:CDS:1 n=1 Tax=Funneliformis caledonium TaxID=1117310 RepID=A0A9N9A012_9GLOM|nr:11313_t:CDS:10 [Funneliformis caledonium]
MNESEKELVKFLRLNYSLRYKNGDFIPSQPCVGGGQLTIEKFTQILIYKPTQDISLNSVWDSLAFKFNDDKFDQIKDQTPLLAKTDIKLIFPVLRITYFGEPLAGIKLPADKQPSNSNDDEVKENFQEFLSGKILVGGSLVIKNGSMYNPLELDRLKAHLSWSINEAEYLNKVYKFETASVIAYESIVSADNISLEFNNRLIPGVMKHHKGITFDNWVLDNIYLNLPFWIKKYQLNHGMVITPYGLAPGKKPVLEFLSAPSIKSCNQSNQTKIKISHSIIHKELLYSKHYIDYASKIINLEEIPFISPFNTTFANVTQCNIFQEEVIITIFNEIFQKNQIIKPSQQFVKEINEALKNINPYKSLTKVFSEYGHMVCTEITMGGRLCTTNQFVTQKEFCQKWTVSKDCVKTMLVNLLEKFNMDVPNKLIAHDHSVNLNEIETWLNDISKKQSLWSLANQPVLFPLYKILDDKYKRQIENILENKQKILMTGVTKLSSHKTRYYRVNFDNHLIGSVVTNNKRLDLNVKFQMADIYGFSIIMEEYKTLNEEIEGDLEVFWQLIGEPKAVGYFSNCTRDTKIFCEELKVEISSRKTSCRINVEEELSPGCIIATSVQYPPSNYEPIIQVFVKSWSGKQIDLDIINHSFDSLFIFVTVQLYVINPNQQESVIADFGCEQVKQVSWKFMGHELKPDNTTIPKFNPRCDLTHEFEERYQIVRSCSYGKIANVYKAYEVNKPKVHYVIKEYKYKTRDSFDRELRMLDELKNTENIIQLINNYPSQAIMVLECALYDLETFLSHQDYNQRHEEKDDIIKDIVTGLSELQQYDIVHTKLTPKSIMHFQEKNGYTERWKLANFDTACFADTNFAMDMFSFGLTLYFIDTENEEAKNEIISEDNLSISDYVACQVISKLLVKSISHRMTLKEFMQSTYYTCDSGKQSELDKRNVKNSTQLVNIGKSVEYDYSQVGYETRNEEIRYQEKLTQESFQAFLKKYHDEVKKRLKIMNHSKSSAEDLSKLTEKIPQWLAKLINEKVPKVFIMIPDRKYWKNPTTWLITSPFRLVFVCENKKKWHIPEQEGYKVLKVPQFIKKYGPWINLCLQTLACVMTINDFPYGVANVLMSVFNISDNSDLMKHFQEIIDTVNIGIETIVDENPDFIPLNKSVDIPHQMINNSGLRELEVQIIFGGLKQSVDEETQEILWLCEKHINDIRSNEKTEPSFRNCDYVKILTDPLVPFFELEHLYKILCEVINNAVASGGILVINDEIKKIARKLYEHKNRFRYLCLNWCDITQKAQFIGIVKNQVHAYIHYLSCIVDDFNSVTKENSSLFSEKLELILMAGKSFNNHLGKLIVALDENIAIQTELDNFNNEPELNINIDNSTIIRNQDLSRWYLRAYIETLESSLTETEEIFDSTKRLLDNSTIASGKSLKYRYLENSSYVEKEIYFYNEYQLNDHDYIIKFYGYSIQNCKPILFYEYANYGDLFTYFQINDFSLGNLAKDLKRKIKLAWEISQGVKYLHNKGILHLDLRSANILLQYDETENFLMPRISNFLWSKSLRATKTSTYPKRKIPHNEMIWKRWHDPGRLSIENFEPLPPSDIYSLGLLFWEIFWCKAENLPFKDIPIKELSNHLLNHKEKLPEMPEQLELLVDRMWQFRPEDRHDITTIETALSDLFKDIQFIEESIKQKVIESPSHNLFARSASLLKTK